MENTVATTSDLLATMVHDAGALRDVARLTHADLPDEAEGYVLTFEHAVYTARVNLDDDSLELTAGAPLLDDGYSLTACATRAPWPRALGHRLRWAWLLTNQQGYRDALQLELADPDDPTATCVQLLAGASRIALALVERCE